MEARMEWRKWNMHIATLALSWAAGKSKSGKQAEGLAALAGLGAATDASKASKSEASSVS